MFTGMLHTHTLVVVLFLLLYLIKTSLLYFSSPAVLDNFIRKTKVAEMIISTLFLATGIYLAMNSGNIGMWFWLKLLAIAVSIPVAVFAFKRRNKGLAAMALMLIVYAYGISETKSPYFKQDKPEISESIPPGEVGKYIYTDKCMKCHGPDGRGGLSGAKDLSASTLSRDEKKEIIRNGKNAMQGFGKVLTEEQIESVMDYIETL